MPLLATTWQLAGALWGDQHPGSVPGATVEARGASHVLHPNSWSRPSLESGSCWHKKQAAFKGGGTRAGAGGAETLRDPADPAAARAPADLCLRWVFAAYKQRDGKADGLDICPSAFMRKPSAVQMPVVGSASAVPAVQPSGQRGLKSSWRHSHRPAISLDSLLWISLF